MANTRKSTKRAKQALKRNTRNQIVRSSTKTALRDALRALQTPPSKDANVTSLAQQAYHTAVKALSKAASKGALPPRRAARKISRLARLAKKQLPAALAPLKK